MKHISILITLCALVFAQMAHAAQIVGSVTENGIKYSLYDDNTAGLVACFRDLAPVDIVLPSTITYEGKDYTLTTIGNEAFIFFSELISVTIPNSVSTIGTNAFCLCPSLKSVTIGASVHSIGMGAFDGCNNLEKITFYPTTPPTFGENVLSATSFIVYCADVYSYKNSLAVFRSPMVILQSIFELKDPRYENAVLEAIDIAANSVTLPEEDKAAIGVCKTNITEAFQDFEINPDTKNTQSVVCENDLAAHRVIALAGIRQALPGGLIEEEQTVLDGKIAKINDANSLGAIYTPQKEALDWMALHQERISALADIEAAKQGNTDSKYLNDLVKEQVAAIFNATAPGTISDNQIAAVNALNAAVPVYKAAQDETKASALGILGEKQNGPALIVTDQDDKQIILYSPKKVQYIKVSDK